MTSVGDPDTDSTITGIRKKTSTFNKDSLVDNIRGFTRDSEDVVPLGVVNIYMFNMIRL